MKLHDILDTIVGEASAAAKQAKAQGLEYMSFGRWGKDGVVTHRSSGGKLIAVKPGGVVNTALGAAKKTGDALKTMIPKAPNLGIYTPPGDRSLDMPAPPAKPRWLDEPQEPKAAARARARAKLGLDHSYLQLRKDATPAEKTLVSKVHGMWNQVANNDFLDKHVGKSYPVAEFEKMTGIPEKAARAFTNAVNDYESPFHHFEHPDGNTVYISDPEDV